MDCFLGGKTRSKFLSILKSAIPCLLAIQAKGPLPLPPNPLVQCPLFSPRPLSSFIATSPHVWKTGLLRPQALFSCPQLLETMYVASKNPEMCPGALGTEVCRRVGRKRAETQKKQVLDSRHVSTCGSVISALASGGRTQSSRSSSATVGVRGQPETLP